MRVFSECITFKTTYSMANKTDKEWYFGERSSLLPILPNPQVELNVKRFAKHKDLTPLYLTPLYRDIDKKTNFQYNFCVSTVKEILKLESIISL